MNNFIKVQNISKSFQVGNQRLDVLKDISLDIKDGEFVIIVGPSGCGKSTLLHVLLGLEPPDVGNVSFSNFNLYRNTDEDQRSDFRQQSIGVIFQQSNWLQALNVLENIALPRALAGAEYYTAMNEALECLNLVNLGAWKNLMPSELSSGQQQMVALSRALITDPKIIVADEPTGNLDFKAGENLVHLLQSLNKEKKKTIVMVTHDYEYLQYADRVIEMKDGKVIAEYAGDGLGGFADKIKKTISKKEQNATTNE